MQCQLGDVRGGWMERARQREGRRARSHGLSAASCDEAMWRLATAACNAKQRGERRQATPSNARAARHRDGVTTYLEDIRNRQRVDVGASSDGRTECGRRCRRRRH